MLERTYDTGKETRTDFLNFCLNGINFTRPCAHRMLCMKLAYAQCHTVPELAAELLQVLELVEYGPMSPGIASAKRIVMRKIRQKGLFL